MEKAEIRKDISDYARRLMLVYRDQRRMLTPLPTASMNADIRLDAETFPALDLQQRTERKMFVCEEALLGACTFIGSGDRLFPLSAYPLLRVCIEGAATILWLLSPKTPKERLGRLCLLEIDDLEHRRRYLRALNKAVPQVEELAAAKATRKALMASARKLGVASQIGNTSGRSVTARLRELDGRTNRNGVQLNTLLWSLCSASIHGSDWSTEVLTSELSCAFGDQTLRTTIQNQEMALNFLVQTAEALAAAHDRYGALAGVDISARARILIDEAGPNESQSA